MPDWLIAALLEPCVGISVWKLIVKNDVEK